MTLLGKSLSLTFSGESTDHLLDQLKLAATKAQMLGYTDVDLADASDAICMRLKIVQMKRDTSFAHALSYAMGEVGRGRSEALGIIWDGTSVRLSTISVRQESA
ncbi:MAG: hypothetical protein KC766_03160 [Myxococcales bacterium]|nr:hypothetical protein [Myxococcales bacterium]